MLGEYNYPKVLIISHEVINLDTSVGKTLHSYFSEWPKEKLCQIYLHLEIPTTHKCEKYFRITDFDILKSLNLFIKPGRVFDKDDINENLKTARADVGMKKKIYQKGRQRKNWMFILRNMLWGIGTWKNKKLIEWVENNRPDVIFLPTSDYLFPYSIAQFISKKFNIPIVVCVFDDYYFGKINRSGILNKINIYFLRKKTEKIFNKAKFILYNQPKMQQLYSSKFKVKNNIFYVSSEENTKKEEDNKKIKISYIGTLGLGRNKSILDIGRALMKVRPSIEYCVDVYSQETDQKKIEKMTLENGINFMGGISSEEVKNVIAKSEVLILPESFEKRYFGRIEYALSTKIPEYLGSNRCILAYGPKNAGSIQYLLDNDVACVVTNKKDLEDCIKEIISDKVKRNNIVKKQYKLYKKNHTFERNSRILRNAFYTALDLKETYKNYFE